MNDKTTTTADAAFANALRRSSSLGTILEPALAPLFWPAEHADAASLWSVHAPFARWLVNESKPRILVDLGIRDGVSYASFCQAVECGKLVTRCYAVETGGSVADEQNGEVVDERFRDFHDARFSTFSTVLRCAFDEGLHKFSDGSIDLLHLDGCRTCDADRQFERWRAKLSERAVVLVHGINESRDDVGVRRLWAELSARYPHFAFLHGRGLGAVAVGPAANGAVLELCLLHDSERAVVRERFAMLGQRPRLESEHRALDQYANAGSIREIDAVRQEFQTRLAAAAGKMQQAQAAASSARRQIELAEAERAAMAARAAAIENSTIWRGTRPLRALLGRSPRIRRAVKSTFRTARRVLDFRASSERMQLRLLARTPLFDAAWYLARYPDVAASGQQPARHFLRFGAAEGRSPGPDFDSAAYLDANPDVAAKGMNPLVHYLRHGIQEGRPRNAAPSYARWVREHDTLNDEDRRDIRAHVDALAHKPLISVVVPVYNTERQHLEDMIESVLRQLYPYWELCIADDASTHAYITDVLDRYASRDSRIKVVKRPVNGSISAATNSALELATGEYVGLLDHDDLLAEHALYEIAVELNAHPDADVIYSDSDSIDERGQRSSPYFKTDWDPDLMLGHNMVSHLGVYRRSLVEELGRLRVGLEGSQDYDLMLRAAETTAAERIRHIPTVLYHWRRKAEVSSFSEAALDRCVVAARRAIRSHLQRKGIRARVEAAPGAANFNRIVYELPAERPLVSLIVPTRDRADLLARCADGVLMGTDYEPLELIVVDNDSREPESLTLLARLARDSRVRIIQHPGAFNYAAMNNRAVNEARGEVVVLLNNDVEVLSPTWLEELVSHALRPDVGAVGAKLLYPDGRVQHAGVALGVGHGAGHVFDLLPGTDLGYFGLAALTRRVSAVTAACMAIRRATYLEVGGMDEVNLPVAFNDVDLCLRLRQRGYSAVWTPYAELLHRHSATRGSDLDGERASRLERDAAYLRRQWGSALDSDPYYNPNCSVTRLHFEPAAAPRRNKPWRAFRSETSATPASNRTQMLLAGLDRSARVIEIGPSFSPIAAKADGWNAMTVDHAPRLELVKKYRGHPGVDVDRIEEVDFVWTRGSLADAVPVELHGTFDALIASHVIEHVPDFVGFLGTAEQLLAPTGVVVLAVPDKRYCFDFYRPLTSTGDVLEAHALRRSRHSPRTLFNHKAYVVKNAGAGAWGQAVVHESDFEFFHSLEEAAAALASTTDGGADAPYIDAHAWQFSPDSFELLLLELAWLKYTDWQIQRITPPAGHEFHVWLRRGGLHAAAAMSPAELAARRFRLMNRMIASRPAAIGPTLSGD
jgi:glycosyltransferase involved in cell wall biosynthesis